MAAPDIARENRRLGLQLRVPLTSDTADYEAQVASVNRRIAERSLTRTQQDVELEVRRAHDDAATAAARIETSTTAFLRARDNLESEAKRYTLGASRTDDVIRKIEAYARALATVSRARADHRIAIAAVERASASNLERAGILVPTGDEAGRPTPEDVGAGKAEPPEPRLVGGGAAGPTATPGSGAPVASPVPAP